MLPYEDGKKLEKLLEELFQGNDKSTPEDIVVLISPIGPIKPLGNCCSYNYGDFNN